MEIQKIKKIYFFCVERNFRRILSFAVQIPTRIFKKVYILVCVERNFSHLFIYFILFPHLPIYKSIVIVDLTVFRILTMLGIMNCILTWINGMKKAPNACPTNLRKTIVKLGFCRNYPRQCCTTR
jgi:hypothetical protein